MPANHPWKTGLDAEHCGEIGPVRFRVSLIRKGDHVKWVLMDLLDTVYAEGTAKTLKAAKKAGLAAKREARSRFGSPLPNPDSTSEPHVPEPPPVIEQAEPVETTL